LERYLYPRVVKIEEQLFASGPDVRGAASLPKEPGRFKECLEGVEQGVRTLLGRAVPGSSMITAVTSSATDLTSFSTNWPQASAPEEVSTGILSFTVARRRFYGGPLPPITACTLRPPAGTT
jgi:hypothetical protein